MFTPAHLILSARMAFVIGGAALAVVMLGPFQGAERALGLSDKAAHGLAFYTFTVLLFMAAPRTRRTDLALIVVGLAVASEVLQMMTGRSAELGDLGLDLLGIGAALAPALVERARHYARLHLNRTFADIRAADRREPRIASVGAVRPARR
jgi:VanZ family protein